MDKKSVRLKRATKIRCKIRQLNANRLSVHKSSQHIYAQIISGDGSKTIVSASTNQQDVKKNIKNTCNIAAAVEVGKTIAQKAIEAGINEVAFDRSGFKYHGRIKALAEAAREAGLKF